MQPLAVIHVLRAPVGGLFRHVRDLVSEQAAAGLRVGAICDSSASDGLTASRLSALEPHLALGLHKVRMSRDVGLADLGAWRRVRDVARQTAADVLHGHGAKGGAYARLAAAALRRSKVAVRCIYTPHGGSLHYSPSSLKGGVFMSLERHLAGMTDGIVFESAYSERVYRRQVGAPACAVRVIHNGVGPDEVVTHRPAADAADVLFIGELRLLKGVDVLLEALGEMARQRPVTALIVGDGPDRARFEAQARELGLQDSVRFAGAMPAREAFGRARVLAMPSRAESFPYVVLEAAAAGIPMVATDVGGIGEIVEGTDTELVAAEDAAALRIALEDALADPERAARRAAGLQRKVAQTFTTPRMAASITAFYRELTSR